MEDFLKTITKDPNPDPVFWVKGVPLSEEEWKKYQEWKKENDIK